MSLPSHTDEPSYGLERTDALRPRRYVVPGVNVGNMEGVGDSIINPRHSRRR